MHCNLPAYVEHAPDYVVRKGKIYVTFGTGFTLVLPIDAWLRGTERGKRAIVEWQRGRGAGEVIDFPARLSGS